MAAISIWVLAASLEYSTGYLVVHVFFAKLAYIGIVAIGPFFLSFSLQYTQNEKYLTPLNRTLVWVVPIIGLASVATDHWHHLFYTDVAIPADSYLFFPVYSHGPLYWVVILYTYLLLLFSVAFLVRALVRAKGRYRTQYLVVLVGLLVPWIANIFYVADLVPLRGVDLSPFTLTLSGTFVALGIRFFGFMELIPIAREKTFEELRDAILVLDNQNNIVDLNPAARIIVENISGGSRIDDRSRIIGKPAQEVFAPLPELVAYLDSGTESTCEIDWEANGQRVYYEARCSPINGHPAGQIGSTVLLQEITLRKTVEAIEVEQRNLAEALIDTASALTSTLDFDEVLERILGNIARVLPHDAAVIGLIEEGDMVRFVRIKGLEKEREGTTLPIVLKLDETANLSEMARTGGPKVIPDVRDYHGWLFIPQMGWVKSFIGAPIKTKGKLLGFLNLYSRVSGFFKPEQAGRLQSFADQAAIAIENARLYQDARERLLEQSTLNQIIRSVSSRLDLKELLEIVDQQLNSILNTTRLLIVTFDKENKKWRSIYERGLEAVASSQDYSMDQGLIGYVIENRCPLLFESQQEIRNFFEKNGLKRVFNFPESEMLIPLTVSDQVIGAMAVFEYDAAKPFREDQLSLFNTIGSQVSIALENARLFSQVEQLAMYDTLNGLHNRYHFFQETEQELARARRYHKPLALAMIDIDNFKKVNDTYGHIAGDLVLQHIAQVCRLTMRKIDIIGRYGGEEFVILMPETNRQNACRAASRLRQRIEETVTYIPMNSIRVTVSIGIAALEDASQDIPSLINRADQALYKAKQAGRNRVHLYEKEE